jgi:hypothetical protein
MSAGYSAARGYGLLSAVGALGASFDTLLSYPTPCDDDGVRDPREQCDGDDLGGLTCADIGLGGGALTCAPGCVLDTTACKAAPQPDRAACGDLVVSVGEECEGAGTLSAASCGALGYSPDATPLRCGSACLIDSSSCRYPALRDLSVGPGHACAILDRSGEAQPLCWGDNRAGQAVAPQGSFSSLALGERFSCGVTTSGALRCWGAPLRDDEGDTPEVLTSGVLQITAIHGAVCALTQVGTLPKVRCFGDGMVGEAPMLSLNVSDIQALALSDQLWCVKNSSGSINCNEIAIATPLFVSDTGSLRFTALDNMVCIVSGEAQLQCFVYHEAAFQLASITESRDLTFADVRGDGWTVCALGEDQSWQRHLVCWQRTSEGAVTLDEPVEPFADPAFGGLRLSDRYDVGEGYVCAEFEGGDVYCADVSASAPPRRLGQGLTPSVRAHAVSVAPTRSPTGSSYGCAVKRVGDAPGYLICWGGVQHAIQDRDLVSVSVSATSLCALRQDGTPRCQGLDGGPSWGLPPAPMRVVHAGERVACGVRREGGGIACWGDPRFTPGFDTPPDGEFVDVRVMGNTGACGLTVDGALVCSPSALQPPPEHANTRWLSFDGARDHACGTTTAGRLVCWGEGAPPSLASQDLATVSGGPRSGCALRRSATSFGALRCWGDALDLVLKPGSTTDYRWRTFDLLDVSVGEGQVCGLRRNGDVVCAGQVELGYR